MTGCQTTPYLWRIAPLGRAGPSRYARTGKRMELVDTAAHRGVAHEGPASGPRRAARRCAGIRGGVARGVAVANVYMTIRDVCKEAGIAQPDYEVRGKPYYFLADDGSVFIVEQYCWPRSMFSSPRRRFLAGPREGQTQEITGAQVKAHRKEAEARWGRYIPGTLFREPRFIPGTERKTLPFYENGIPNGYIDETGIHRYRTIRWGQWGI